MNWSGRVLGGAMDELWCTDGFAEGAGIERSRDGVSCVSGALADFYTLK